MVHVLLDDTRNGRTIRFEEKLYQANTEELLSEISQKYERSLMLRMIGPHQALRLERMGRAVKLNLIKLLSELLTEQDKFFWLAQNVMAMMLTVQNMDAI